MRLVSASISVNVIPPKRADRLSRPESNFTFGVQLWKKTGNIFGEHTALALATCRFTIMGSDAHNYNGGPSRTQLWRPSCQNRWCLTKLQTLGYLPSRNFRRNGRSEWVESNCFAGADDILQFFNLNMNEVLAKFGNVQRNERKIIDLKDVVERMWIS